MNDIKKALYLLNEYEEHDLTVDQLNRLFKKSSLNKLDYVESMFLVDQIRNKIAHIKSINDEDGDPTNFTKSDILEIIKDSYTKFRMFKFPEKEIEEIIDSYLQYMKTEYEMDIESSDFIHAMNTQKEIAKILFNFNFSDKSIKELARKINDFEFDYIQAYETYEPKISDDLNELLNNVIPVIFWMTKNLIKYNN